MKYNFLVTPRAKKEFIDAYEYYEEKADDLGEKFRKEVYHLIYLIIDNPLHYPLKTKNQREVVLKKFPFVILFRIEEITKTIYVSSIFHTKRNPKLK